MILFKQYKEQKFDKIKCKKHVYIDSKVGYKKMSPYIYSLLRISLITLACDELAMLSCPMLSAIVVAEVFPTAKEIVEQESIVPK